MIIWKINQLTGKKISKDFFQKIVKISFKTLEIKEADISIAIIKEEEIKKANKEYRAKDSITDVLSFIYEKDPLEGEILICYQRALEQAKKNKRSLAEEITILLIHGLVHLAGFNHQKNSDAKKMKTMEAMILKKLSRHPERV